ncbi:putative alpha-13-mannosyltransferase MNN12 [Meyerozyma sp. JA9]|nr:putative alpha-13-mannosyltransferase MNN12 [Meyerozyma sp. JA9]
MARRIRSNFLKLVIVVACVSILIWLQGLGTSPDIPHVNEESFKHILTETYRKSDILNSISISDDTYDEMFKHMPFSTVISSLDFDERCDLYFKTLFQKNPQWYIEPTKNFSFNKKYFMKYSEYEKSMVEEYKKKKEKESKDKKKEEEKPKREPQEPEIPSDIKEQWKSQYKEAWDNILRDEQLLHDFMSHLRIYNKCYVEHDVENFATYNPESNVLALNDSDFIHAQREVLAPLHLPSAKYKMRSHFKHFASCQSMESSIYPWLTSKYPTYKRWDNTKLIDELPQYAPRSHARKSYHKSSFAKDSHSCFLNQFKNNLNGRGIVLTIADGHLEMTIRLIRLLRALGNELPIQIVYLQDLAFETKYQLVQASRSDFKGYPKQDLWFVDVSGALNEKFAGKFGGFGNKILATFFNSFEEMILLDADTVLLEKPEFFFNLEKYIKTGTMFYKDRSAIEFRPKNDIIFFKKMLPSIMDTIMFNIPQTTEYTLRRQFFQGKNHYMESGLVVINRKLHFSQALVMAQLNFHLPIQARVYGDKELFWLALVISGNENYAFNEHFAAAIGTITPDTERWGNSQEVKPLRSKEVCSNHPAHINDEDNQSLLWFNSGFRHCGQSDKVDFEKEFAYKRRYTHLKKLSQFKAFFVNKLEIKYAVIPPVDTSKADNDDNESNMPWISMGGYCNGYTWCGYSSIGGTYTKDGEKLTNRQDGILIKFTDSETRRFQTLGDIWISKFDYRSPEKIKSDQEKDKKKENVDPGDESAILKALEQDRGDINGDSQWWISE